jgi:hypothetical protein
MFRMFRIIGFIILFRIIKGEYSSDSSGIMNSIMKVLQLEYNVLSLDDNYCSILYQKKNIIDEYINDYSYKKHLYVPDIYTLDLFRKEVSQEIYQRCSYTIFL